MIIPFKEIAEDTLNNLIDYYITVERSTCNEACFDLSKERGRVLAALQRNECVVEYSETHESAYIVPVSKFQAKTRA